MNERDILDAITRDSRAAHQDVDQRPLWVRLLASFKISISLRPDLRRPIKNFMIKGRVEF